MNPRYNYNYNNQQPDEDPQQKHMQLFQQFLQSVAPYLPTQQSQQQQSQFDAEAPVRDATVANLNSEAARNTATADAAPDLAAAKVGEMTAMGDQQANRLNAFPQVGMLLSQLGIPKEQIAQYFGQVDPRFGGIHEAAQAQQAALRGKIISGQDLTPEEQTQAGSDPGLGLLMATQKATKKNK